MISSAIIQTLTYSDHFDFPLTFSEIQTRLIKEKIENSKALLVALEVLIKSNKILKTGDYYHLPGRESLVPRRLKQERLGGRQLPHAKEIASKLGHVGGVMAVYLTGSLAMSNSDYDGDIDFMIIAKNKRLWTARLLLTIYTELLGLRRRPHSVKNSGKVCLNLYLAPSSFSLPLSKRSLYTAYELIQAIPLYDPQLTQANLLSSNAWLSDYLPNFNYPTIKTSPTKDRGHKINILDILEKLLYWFQRNYMKSKITREYIREDAAFFHPNNPGSKVLKKISQ